MNITDLPVELLELIIDTEFIHIELINVFFSKYIYKTCLSDYYKYLKTSIIQNPQILMLYSHYPKYISFLYYSRYECAKQNLFASFKYLVSIILSGVFDSYFNKSGRLNREYYHCVCNSAISCDNIKFLKYAYSINCVWNSQTYESAASNGYVKCLKFMFENKCIWTDKICQITKEYDMEHNNMYANKINNTNTWNNTISMAAAYNGSYKCFKYCLEHGCPYITDTFTLDEFDNNIDCIYFNYAGYTKCIKYAYTHGYTISQDMIDRFNLTKYKKLIN